MSKFTHDGMKIPLAPQVQDPNDITDWGCDWTDWLKDAEVIITSTWILPTGLTNTAETRTNTTTSVFISGGVIGTKYLITNRVTTVTRTEDRSMYIICQEK